VHWRSSPGAIRRLQGNGTRCMSLTMTCPPDCASTFLFVAPLPHLCPLLVLLLSPAPFIIVFVMSFPPTIHMCASWI
jgi:hypothetical protein